ncbi:hypothetical protein Anas_02111 [Armadillidium nasatum]|uniref:GST N-terminal domain-containing protein n=1 Tax=Armadillidium nasatum TaxID=96803 RepID=A0A5N5THV4_9CRUS|nr:hypothetical protein Anas_02111 [Armadillidium nasatum]
MSALHKFITFKKYLYTLPLLKATGQSVKFILFFLRNIYTALEGCDIKSLLMNYSANDTMYFGYRKVLLNSALELMLAKIKMMGDNIGEHKTPEYAKVNPFQLVPALDDNGLKLSESFLSYDVIDSIDRYPLMISQIDN